MSCANCERLRKALENIKRHQELVTKGAPQLSATWSIATAVLAAPCEAEESSRGPASRRDATGVVCGEEPQRAACLTAGQSGATAPDEKVHEVGGSNPPPRRGLAQPGRARGVNADEPGVTGGERPAPDEELRWLRAIVGPAKTVVRMHDAAGEIGYLPLRNLRLALNAIDAYRAKREDAKPSTARESAKRMGITQRPKISAYDTEVPPGWSGVDDAKREPAQDLLGKYKDKVGPYECEPEQQSEAGEVCKRCDGRGERQRLPKANEPAGHYYANKCKACDGSGRKKSGGET